jgi:hypothetical protein
MAGVTSSPTSTSVVATWLPFAAVGVGCGIVAATVWSKVMRSHRGQRGNDNGDDGGADCASGAHAAVVVAGLEGLIGNTPLVEIKSLSRLTGCRILGKAELLNPGGSSKDR